VKRGPPFANDDNFEQVKGKYQKFLRKWGHFGLSKACDECGTLTPGRYCLLTVEEDGEDGLQELSGEEDQVRFADFAANPADLSRPQCLGAAAAGHGEGEPGPD